MFKGAQLARGLLMIRKKGLFNLKFFEAGTVFLKGVRDWSDTDLDRHAILIIAKIWSSLELLRYALEFCQIVF